MRKYIRPWPTFTWFTRRPGYTLFMVRELTSVFIAVYLVALLYFLSQLSEGREAFVALLHELHSPGWMLLHAIVLLGAVWHAVTWFNLTPMAMPIFIGEKKAPGAAIAIAMGYAPWVVVSILIVWLVCP